MDFLTEYMRGIIPANRPERKEKAAPQGSGERVMQLKEPRWKKKDGTPWRAMRTWNGKTVWF